MRTSHVALLVAMLCLPGIYSCSSEADAWMSPIIISGGVEAAAGGWPDFDYDIWVDYESCSDCTDAQLELTDNNASSQSYSLSDASSELDCQDGSANKNGTYGMSYDYSGGNAGYVALTYPSSESAVSGGFWYYFSDLGAGESIYLLAIRHAGGTLCSATHYGGSDYIRFYCADGANNSSMSVDNWYWITWVVNQNGTSELRVYDTSESQVGSDLEVSTADSAATLVRWGGTAVGSGEAVSVYFDDFCIDWTDATFPLGDGA